MNRSLPLHAVRIIAVGVFVSTSALQVAAVAEPRHGEGQADARQLPRGGQVEAELRTVDAEPGNDTGSANRPPSGGPGPHNEGGITASDGLITHHWVATGVNCWYGEAGGEPVAGSPDGEIYERVQVDRSTDPPTEMVIIAECFDPVEAPNTPPPPPPPPTLEEMTGLARELIIVPDVQLSPDPDVGGVTGLETWFWYDGQDDATVSVGIRGYTVTASMTPSRYYWDPDDPRGDVLASDQPGSEEDPAAIWVYESKDEYEVRVQVVWDGTWSFAGHGASASGDLPTIRATGSTAYRVDEVRSELTAPR